MDILTKIATEGLPDVFRGQGLPEFLTKHGPSDPIFAPFVVAWLAMTYYAVRSIGKSFEWAPIQVLVSIG
jgi:hypothetical protein